MKVIHINFSLETGGTETLLVDILNEQCLRADLHFILINDQYDANLLARIDSRVTIWRNRTFWLLCRLFVFRCISVVFLRLSVVLYPT